MTGSPAGGWVMWEARAADGRAAQLLQWALEQAIEDAQVYASADRVVVIHPVASSALASPPAELLARPAYQWEFERVR
jgi:hypothetical protein